MRKLKKVKVKIKEKGELSRALDKLREKVSDRTQTALYRDFLPESNQKPERVKTSLLLDNKLLLQAKRQANLMGLSFNAYVSMAIYNQMNRPTEQFDWGRPMWGTDVIKPGPRYSEKHMPNFRPKSKALAKFGDGFRYDEGDDHWFATWDQVKRYSDALTLAPDATWMDVAKALDLKESVARAADMALASDQWREYVKARWGGDHD